MMVATKPTPTEALEAAIRYAEAGKVPVGRTLAECRAALARGRHTAEMQVARRAEKGTA